MTSTFAGLFPGSTFGWPALNAANLPAGGIAYPFAAPGVRVKIDPSENWSFLAAVFNGDPAGPGDEDAQRLNRHGTNFRVNDPAFAIAEAQYKYNQGKKDTGLAGTIKLGGWYHFGSFDDQRFDRDGFALSDPVGSGVPARIRGNHGIYAVIDQQLYRPAGAEADKGIGMFARVMASPEDQNLLSFYVDGGLTFAGLNPNRPNDSFGIAVAYGEISNRARGADRDAIAFSGSPQPIRDYEALIEITYSAQVADGWTVQPDFQYIWNPGGKVADPKDPTGASAVKDVTVVGIRTTLKY